MCVCGDSSRQSALGAGMGAPEAGFAAFFGEAEGAAAGLGLGGNESYPDLFQPYGGFPDGVAVVDGHITMPELPGIGFEGKSALIRVMRGW